MIDYIILVYNVLLSRNLCIYLLKNIDLISFYYFYWSKKLYGRIIIVFFLYYFTYHNQLL